MDDVIGILKKHEDEIKKRYRVKKIGIFGSHATGEQKESSDIDVLVEFDEPTFDNFMELSFYLENLFGRNVDILTPAGVKGIRVKEVAEDIMGSVVYV